MCWQLLQLAAPSGGLGQEHARRGFSTTGSFSSSAGKAGALKQTPDPVNESGSMPGIARAGWGNCIRDTGETWAGQPRGRDARGMRSNGRGEATQLTDFPQLMSWIHQASTPPHVHPCSRWLQKRVFLHQLESRNRRRGSSSLPLTVLTCMKASTQWHKDTSLGTPLG